jgi:hypothetical protein
MSFQDWSKRSAVRVAHFAVYMEGGDAGSRACFGKYCRLKAAPSTWQTDVNQAYSAWP